MKLRHALLVCAIAAAAACARPENGPKPITVSIQPFTVEPGQEITKCQVIHLENEEPFDFNRVRSTMAPGSHHLFVYADAAYLAGQQPQPDGFGDCVMDGMRLPVYPAQTAEYEAVMPEGVAAQLPRNTVLIVEAHYVNAGSTAIEAGAEVTFFPADPATIEHYSGMVVAADLDFAIPPGAGMNGTAPYVHGDVCAMPEAMNVYRLGSHGHKRLAKFEILAHDGLADGPELYENLDWSSPAEVIYPDGAPLEVAAGEGFRFACTWHNETDAPIEFGSSVEDEMCIMGAAYYPRIEGQYGLGGVVVCIDGQIYY